MIRAVLALALLLGSAPARTNTNGNTTTWLVLPFDVAHSAPLEADLGAALADLLALELGPDPVVDRARLDAVLKEQGLGTSDLKLGQLLAATAIVTGSLTEEDGAVEARMRVIDVATGEIRGSGIANGRGDDLAELARELGRSARPEEREGAGPAVDPAAARYRLRFGTALGAHLSDDHTRAVAGFLDCLRRKEDHAPARCWLARSYLALGQPLDGWIVLRGVEGEAAKRTRLHCEEQFGAEDLRFQQELFKE